MKKLIISLLAWLCTSVSSASYTYTITEYQFLGSISGTESMLITDQGGGGYAALFDNSSLTIESTSTLEEGVGGVWEIQLINNSHLYMTGGQVHEIALGNNATARLTGGLIQQIWSSQYTETYGPHITIVYSGELPTMQTIYGLPHLVGQWGNGDPFAIYLSEVPANNYGYDPAITNIRFELIPEPASLLLLGLGGLLIRNRKS